MGGRRSGQPETIREQSELYEVYLSGIKATKTTSDEQADGNNEKATQQKNSR